jgi:hypothetical protein
MNLLKLQPVTFISLFTAYYFYKRSTRKKEVLYTKVNVKIIQNYNKEISDFVSKYKEKSVDSITVTRYLLWNNSSQAIRKNDIAPKDPLQFSVTSGYKILDAKIIYPKDSLNGFMLSELKKTNNFTKLSFDFINKDEGAIIQIIHTGETNNIRFTGTIIDFKKPVFIEKYDKFDQILGPFIVFMFPIIFCLFLFSGRFLDMLKISGVSGWGVILILAVGSSSNFFAYTRRLIPKKFRSTLNENYK